MEVQRPPRTYTAQQVSEILQIPVTEVYREGAAGAIPGRFRIGRRTRFNASVIDELVAGRYDQVA
jgi:predicted DNA-binding transcriptional regulator AlpA